MLMGFTPTDYENIKKYTDMGDGAIYHCAGDSICVTCLIGIFSSLLGQDQLLTIDEINNYTKELL